MNKKDKKAVIVSASASAAMTVAAIIALNSAFARIERKIIEANGGESIETISEELKVNQKIINSKAEMQNKLYGLNEYYMGLAAKAAAVSPSSDGSRAAAAELQYALSCMAAAITAYQTEYDRLSVKIDMLTSDKGSEEQPKSEDNKTKDNKEASEAPENIKVKFKDKLKMFFTGEAPVIEYDSVEALKEIANERPERPDIQLLSEIETLMNGSVGKETDSAYVYCESTLKKLNDAQAADAAAAAERAKQQNASPASGTTDKNNSSTNKSKSTGSSTKSGSSSQSSSRSSGSSSSGSSSRSSGSSSSGSSSRSSGSVSRPSGGSSSGGSSSGGSSSGSSSSSSVSRPSAGSSSSSSSTGSSSSGGSSSTGASSSSGSRGANSGR